MNTPIPITAYNEHVQGDSHRDSCTLRTIYSNLVAMDAADSLMNRVMPSGELEEDPLFRRPKPAVNCNVVNECDAFIKAEDGSGDARYNSTDKMVPAKDGN